MFRRPPRSTRTAHLVPYTSLCRSTAPPGVSSSEMIAPDFKLSSLAQAIADAVVGGVLNEVLEKDTTDADRSAMAEALVGSGKGNPLDEIAEAVNKNMDVASTSLTQLSGRLSDLPLGFVSTTLGDRSEERSVGKESVSTCRSRWG